MKKNLLLKNIKVTALLGLFFCVFFGMTKAADAATYYVTNAGNDNCSGTSQTIGTSGNCAWKTLAKVNSRTFAPGDSILFKRGDKWFERLLIPSSGTAGKPITFGAYGTGNKPVFDGTGVSLPLNNGLIRGAGKNYIIVENIRVQNVGIGKALENTGIGFYSGSNITVQDCEVRNTESSGIRMNLNTTISVLRNDVSLTNVNSRSEQISISGVNGFEVAYNNSYANGGAIAGSGAGIDSKGGSKNGTIHHNHVWDITSNGIYVDAWDTDTSNIRVYSNYVHDINAVGIMVGAETGGSLHDITIHHNIVHNAKRGGLGFHDEGTTGNSVYNIYFYNNTFNLNGTNGVKYYGGARIWDRLLTGAVFKNNIFSNAHNFQIGYDPSRVQASDILMDRNVVYGVNSNSGGFTAISGTNAITNNPLFVNASQNNYALQSNSPARNACDNSVWQGVPNITDYNGVKITDASGKIVAPGGKVDCGAIEFSESGGTPTTPTCTSFTYSAWSSCTNNLRSRTVTSSSPTGCTGGTPVLTQSCTTPTPTQTPPIISQISRVPALSDETATYTFNSDSTGTVVYGGSCGTADKTTAVVGQNKITWTLANGVYSNCTVTVRNGTTNSNTLAVPSFESTSKYPVVFVHGWLGNSTAWNVAKSYLANKGWKSQLLVANSITESNSVLCGSASPKQAAEVAGWINATLTKYPGFEKVDVVGHSRGGSNTMRSLWHGYIEHSKVRRVVTVAGANRDCGPHYPAIPSDETPGAIQYSVYYSDGTPDYDTGVNYANTHVVGAYHKNLHPLSHSELKSHATALTAIENSLLGIVGGNDDPIPPAPTPAPDTTPPAPPTGLTVTVN